MAERKFGAKNNIQSSRVLFNQRAKYRNDAIPDSLSKRYPGVFRNFWFIENMYYGKIDRLHQFLIPKQEKVKSLQLDGGDAIFLFDFVADALNDMIVEHKKALSSGKISKNDSILTSLRPVKGYTNPLLDYEQVVKKIIDDIYPQLIEKEQEISNFEDFIDVFFSIFYKQRENLPLTLTGFVSSRHSPLTMTGIFLELSDMSYDRDQSKVSELIDGENFDFYIKNSIKHGFLIDSNMPTRLCANLGSNEMENYLFKYNSNSQRIFEDYYDMSYMKDIDYIFQYLINLYNKFVSFRPYIRKEVFDLKYSTDTVRYVERRLRMTRKSFEIKYDNKYKLNLYIEIRNHESGDRYQKPLLDMIKENAISYMNTNDIEAAMIYINHQFIGFLNDPGAYNALVISEDVQKNNPQVSRQEVDDLLDRSVVRSRKTIY